MNAPPQDLHQRLIRKIVALSHPLIPESPSVVPSLKKMAGIKAVLFDVYGTMLVSASGYIGADPDGHRETHLQAALNSCAFSRVVSTACSCGIEWLDRFMGEAQEARRQEGIQYPDVEILEIWKKALEELVGKGLIQGSISEETIACVAVDYECRVNPVWPMPRLQETLSALVGTGRKLGIVSNAQFYTPLTLCAFPQTGWKEGLFEEKLCAWSYKFREAKPSTRLVHSVLRELDARYGIKPPEVLCVGNDKLNDIFPAARMGCKTALFACDRRSYRPREIELGVSDIKADLLITDLIQIPEALT